MKSTKLVIIILLAVMLFSACGGKGEAGVTTQAGGPNSAPPTSNTSSTATTNSTPPAGNVLDESYLQYVYESEYLCYCGREHENPLFIGLEYLDGSDSARQLTIQVGEQSYVGTYAYGAKLHSRNCNVYSYVFMESYELILPEAYDKLSHMFAMPDCEIVFYEDGSPCAIELMGVTPEESVLVPVAVDQDTVATALQAEVEAMLADYLDPEAYEHLEMKENDRSISYRYYNMVDGYELNSAYVLISREGYLEAVRFTDYFVAGQKIGPEDCDFVINKEMEKLLLDLKLKDIYATDEVAYLGYSINEAHICVVEGELYIQYSLQAQLSYSEQAVEQMVEPLLIPVSAIMA